MRPRVRALLASLRYPLTVFAVSRLAVYGLIAAAGWTARVPRQSGLSYHALFGPLGQWDAVWYRWIADHGYDPAIGHGNAAAFYPLYPLTLAGRRRAARADDALGQPALLAALRGGALHALRRHPGPLRRAHGPAHRALPGDLPAQLRLLAALRREPLPAARAHGLRAHLARALVVGLPGGGALDPRPPGRDRPPAGARLAPLPQRGRTAARLPAAAAAARRRARVLPLPGLAHRQLHGQPRCAGARLGARRLGAAVGARLHALARRDRGRPPALPDPHRLHAALVRALLPGLAHADLRRVPDLRRAARAAADERRPARLDGPLRHGRVPALLGARRPGRGRARRHAREDVVPAAHGGARPDHLHRAHVHARTTAAGTSR